MKPMMDRVVVERDEAHTQTTAGLYIPDAAKEKPLSGVVIAVGEGRRATKTGVLMPMTVKEGDRVLFSKFGGQEITHDDKTYLILREDEIFAVIDE